MVAEEGRGRPRVAQHVTRDRVQVCGGDTGPHRLAHRAEGIGDDDAGAPHGGDLLRRLALDLFRQLAHHAYGVSAVMARSASLGVERATKA